MDRIGVPLCRLLSMLSKSVFPNPFGARTSGESPIFSFSKWLGKILEIRRFVDPDQSRLAMSLVVANQRWGGYGLGGFRSFMA